MTNPVSRTYEVRRATEDDVAELMRLRAMLFVNLGGEYFNPSDGDDEWLVALERVLKEKLEDDDAHILVVDGEDGLAACGIGTIEQWFPGPHSRNGRVGHVVGVVTVPEYRRRGYSRAIMGRLLDWFRERDVARVDLFASHDGSPLYRDLGFTDHPDPALYWRP
ncbi:GNAT family N-acetyltransferase [Actinomadura litoris]|nr:GNAT family N-acetyltransferase [Actinomadura litoris]